MGEHVTSRPPEANSEASSQHPTADERIDAELRQLVRLLARIAAAEALGTADAGEQTSTDLSTWAGRGRRRP
jgi:hypothetical protein